MINLFTDNLNEIDFSKYVEIEKPADVCEPNEFKEETLDLLANGETVTGDLSAWSKWDGRMQFRPGEITVWGGINGHKKSYATTQLALAFMMQEKPVLIASLEMKPSSTLKRMIQMCSGVPNPSRQYAEHFFGWQKGKLHILDRLDSVDPDEVLGVIDACSPSLGVKHFILDSLMTIGIASEDYAAQKTFLNKLSGKAKKHNVHIHLVAHAKKTEGGEKKIPSKFDLLGSSNISNLIDNLIMVWMDKEKDSIRNTGKPYGMNDSDYQKIMDRPDVIMKVLKQRHHWWEGGMALWSAPCGQLVDDSNGRAKRFDIGF